MCIGMYVCIYILYILIHTCIMYISWVILFIEDFVLNYKKVIYIKRGLITPFLCLKKVENWPKVVVLWFFEFNSKTMSLIIKINRILIVEINIVF